MNVLAAETLAIGYGRVTVAAGIDLALAAGSVTCLLGPNAAGKTTLFKTLLGLLPPLSGKVMLGDRNLAALPRAEIARTIAYVPQAGPGAFAYTVLDLVVMGRTAYLGAFATPTRADLDIAMQALDLLGIAELAQRDAGRISGGQRQLAMIARALAQQAQLVVMDEPTANLDLGNRLLVLDRIRNLAANGLSVLLSTHEPEQAFALADRVAVLGPGQGFETGTVDRILTADRLTRLYGTPLIVEETPAGRHVVGPAMRGTCPSRP
jgi:iron complex transport system ATP-binding protein